MKNITTEQAREVALELADRLERNTFQAQAAPGDDPELAKIALKYWMKGYQRAIFEIRSMVELPVTIPDDLSELDG